METISWRGSPYKVLSETPTGRYICPEEDETKSFWAPESEIRKGGPSPVDDASLLRYFSQEQNETETENWDIWTSDERAAWEDEHATGEWECSECGATYPAHETCPDCGSELHFIVLDSPQEH